MGWQIPQIPVAAMFIANGGELATDIATGGTFVKIAGTTTAGELNQFTHINGRLTYTGPKRRFHALAVFTISSNLNNAIVHTQLYKSGALVASSEQHRKVAVAGDLGNMSCSEILELETGDYVEIWGTLELGQDAKTITAEHCVLTVK